MRIKDHDGHSFQPYLILKIGIKVFKVPYVAEPSTPGASLTAGQELRSHEWYKQSEAEFHLIHSLIRSKMTVVERPTQEEKATNSVIGHLKA